MTKAAAKAAVKALGLTLTWKDGEFRVNYVGGKEATAYYTTDIDDAIATAKAMKEQRQQ